MDNESVVQTWESGIRTRYTDLVSRLGVIEYAQRVQTWKFRLGVWTSDFESGLAVQHLYLGVLIMCLESRQYIVCTKNVESAVQNWRLWTWEHGV